MNDKALKTLEYTKIIAQLEEYASTSMGKKRCRELVPMNDLQEIKTAQAQTSDALARILRKGSISFSGAKYIRDSLLRLKVGSSFRQFLPTKASTQQISGESVSSPNTGHQTLQSSS